MSIYKLIARHVCARTRRHSDIESDFAEGPEGTGMYHPHEVFHMDCRQINPYTLDHH